MNHFDQRDGELWCEDVPLRRIAEAVGTPTYIYSTATIARHARVMREAVAGSGSGDPLVAYAVKANPNAAVLAVVAAGGLGADVVSIGEYRRALAAGIAPRHIVFSGVGKTADEIGEALGGGVLQFNAESIEELHMLSQVAAANGRTAPVALRINPDVAADTHAKITTGTADNKFGIGAGDSVAASRAARALPNLDLVGLAVHIGSQITSLDPLRAAFERLGELIAALRADGADVRTADLGGGLGVIYDHAQAHPPLPQQFGEMVRAVSAGWDARLIFEPGRLIVANAGVLLSRVVRIKAGTNAPWVIVDAAMNDLMRPSLYEAYHAIEAVAPRGPRILANVVGPICETGDTFAMAREMDRTEPGDLIVFRTAGAYGATMSSSYNSRAVTPEVLVDGDRWAVVRRRVTIDEVAGVAQPQWNR
ncbi:MAG: diaminopimelate decarboxylase [Sphingomicrobium sp.]